MHPFRSVCVFAGSAGQLKEEYIAGAQALGRLLAERGITLVFGAGRTGLMGAVADACLEHGGEVIGVIPEAFNTPALVHSRCTRLEVTEGMHARKARMHQLSEAFIALPGGYGTFEELFETLTWAQVGLHQKPIGVLNTAGYYDPLLGLVQHALTEGFIYAEHPDLLAADSDPAALLDKLAGFQRPEDLARWLERPGE